MRKNQTSFAVDSDQGIEINHLPGRLVAPWLLHPRRPRAGRPLRCRLSRKLLEQNRSRHRRFSTSSVMTGNQIVAVTATSTRHNLGPVN
jgi:hypothetical protein